MEESSSRQVGSAYMKRVRAGEAVPPGRERAARALGEGGKEREEEGDEEGAEDEAEGEVVVVVVLVVLVKVARVRDARGIVIRRDL